METNPSNKFSLPVILAIIVATVYVGCSKSNDASHNSGNTNLSAADKIVGAYTGAGKYLPDGIDLGNTVLCSPPAIDYNTQYITGDASVDIVKLTDSTVKIEFISGPFPIATYPEIKVTDNGNTVDFFQGSYDVSTKTLVFSGIAPNYNYSYSANCKTGLPYYTSTLSPGPSGNPEYFNYTIRRYEFGGTKK